MAEKPCTVWMLRDTASLRLFTELRLDPDQVRDLTTRAADAIDALTARIELLEVRLELADMQRAALCSNDVEVEVGPKKANGTLRQGGRRQPENDLQETAGRSKSSRAPHRHGSGTRRRSRPTTP